jgi:hypothetical protein
MKAKQALAMVNVGLSIYGKLQQIKIRNEKIKAIDRANAIETHQLGSFLNQQNQITHNGENNG